MHRTGRPGRKRLSVDLPEAIHDEVTRLANKRHITLTKFVLRVLLKQIKEEETYENK